MAADIAVIAAVYLAGSVNFSIILFKMLGKEDPRLMYSGNAGATNVYRQAGFFWAAAVLALDVGRAVLAAGIADLYLPPAMVPWACLSLVLGNRFPAFHRFRGGKGVANYLGFTCYLSPVAGAASCAAWFLVYGIARVPFIASFFMIAALAAGTVARYIEIPAAVAGAVVTALFVCINHRGNIAAYLAGKKTEGK